MKGEMEVLEGREKLRVVAPVSLEDSVFTRERSAPDARKRS